MKTNKIILFIVILLMLLLTIFVIIKKHQYNTIINIANANANKRDSKNFYYEVNNKVDNSTFKIWVKESNIKHQVFINKNLIQTQYVDLANKFTYSVSEENHTYILHSNKILLQPVFINAPNILDITFGIINSSFTDKILFAISIKSITSETLNNQNTIKVIYKLDNTLETTWFDSTTLYPIKSEFNSNINTYNLTDCNLSDEDITFTNIKEYNKL